MELLEQIRPIKNDLSIEAFKILLIENDMQTAETVQGWLLSFAQVTHITDAEIAVNMVQNESWNLVIIDVELAGARGLDIINISKSINSWTPILIVSAYQKIEYAVKALQRHADGLLFKPFQKENFLALLLKLATDSEHQRMQLQKCVLAIGAHPDDSEIGCAGALARHHAEGDNINILTLSLGESGGDSHIRKRESESAAEMLKAKLFMSDLTDTQISDGASTIRVIEEVVEKIKPTHIYTHSQHDNHQDHRNTFLAAMVACRNVPNLYCYMSPSTTMDYKPNLFIEISNYMEHKINTLEVYKSQLERRSYLHANIIRATALYWGRFVSYGSTVEPMEVIRQHYK